MSLYNKVENSLQKLIQLNHQKYALLEEMLRITSKRNSLSEVDQPEEILRLIEKRQIYIEKVDVIDIDIQKNVNPVKAESDSNNLPVHLTNLWEEFREQRRSHLQLLDQMRELDRQQKPRLELQILNLKQQHKKVRAGRNTISAYRIRSTFLEGVFIDRKK